MKYALALLLLAGAPAPDGWTTLKAGDETVEVYRDVWGVPHIFAKSIRAAFWAEGYLEAQDRMWQMETFRRGSRGEASSLAGKSARSGDRDRLRRGYTEEELRVMVEAGGPRFRAIVAAYTDGVNSWLKEGRDLPPDYEKLAITPRPWTETDCLAIGIAMARRFGEAGDAELTVAKVYEQLVKKAGEADAKKIVGDLLRRDDRSAPATMNDHLRKAPEPERKKGWRAAPGMSDEAYALHRAEMEEALASREALGMPVYFGSNAWVAAPAKSKSGNAMLYGGPMMGFNAPSICNEIHLVAEGAEPLNVAGMSFPGVPGVMIGWNESLAWTTTSGGADLVDVYTLELNPGNPEEYRYKGEWRKFEVLERALDVRGEPPDTLRVYRSVHGPLVGERDLKNHRAHALRMSFWKKEQGSFEGVLDLNFARTVAEFEAGVAKIPTSHNFFCATKDGQIGFWYAGAHPVRREGHDPRFPQVGDGTMDWEGILPPERWPRKVDPEWGYFANWNNKPQADWAYAGFGKIFWGKKIIDELESREKLSFGDFAAIARLTAYHHYAADYFVPIILEAARGSDDPDVKRGVEILEKWDHMEAEGQLGPGLVDRWTKGAMARMFGGLVDPVLLATREVQRYVADPLLYTLEGEKSLVRLEYDFARGRDLKELVLAALRDAVRAGDEKLAWKEPSVDFKGEVGKVKSKNGRGTFQMAVEMMPDGPRAVTVSAPGQSERPGAPHYRDQAPLFEKWEYKLFLWKREEMK